MGTFFSSIYYEGTRPAVLPARNETPTFEPQFGFKGQRKERVSKISYEEMKALKMEKEKRDYCAHFLKDYSLCFQYYKPFYGLCYPELEALKHCRYDDFVIRMKEYEREKRLRIREAKLKGIAA